MGAGEPRFGVLGPLLIEADGRPVPPPGSPVVRGLLGVLLLTAGRPLTTEQLIDLVWADLAGRGVAAAHGADQRPRVGGPGGRYGPVVGAGGGLPAARLARPAPGHHSA